MHSVPIDLGKDWHDAYTKLCSVAVVQPRATEEVEEEVTPEVLFISHT